MKLSRNQRENLYGTFRDKRPNDINKCLLIIEQLIILINFAIGVNDGQPDVTDIRPTASRARVTSAAAIGMELEGSIT